MSEIIVLRRGGRAAAWWSLLGAALLGAGGFFVVDSDGHPVAWAVTALFAVPTVHFVLQLVWPSSLELRLDQDRLRSRAYWRSRTVSWDDVHVAKVRRAFGDPVLVIDVRQPDGDLDRVRVPLPVGADLVRLHVFLGERLGRGSRLRAPHSLRPLDL